jgi:hypothetical protein
LQYKVYFQRYLALQLSLLIFEDAQVIFRHGSGGNIVFISTDEEILRL